MKYTIYLSFIVMLVTGCSSSSAKQVAGSLVTTDSLLGNWMIVDIGVSGNDKKKNELMESVVESLKNAIELSALSFHSKNALQVYDGNIAISYGNWTLLADTLRLGHAFGESKVVAFTITKFQHDSLIMENLFENSKDNLRVSYTLKRIYVPDSTINIFDAAQNAWRVKPSQPEEEAAMRQRLKQMLVYYSAYFATFSKNKISYFNREKIFCPLLFYSDGLSLRAVEEENDKWEELFYNKEDAQKAFKLLDKAFSQYTTYPDLGDDRFVQEYVVALKQLSERL